MSDFFSKSYLVMGLYAIAIALFLPFVFLLTERLLKLTSQLRTTRLNSRATQSREVLFAFGRLHDSDIDWMIANGSCQLLPADSILLQEGRPAETLYLLLRGLAKVAIAETATNPLDWY